MVASFISLATTFLQKSECAHAAAPPFKITTASLGCDFVLGTDLGVRASKVFGYYTFCKIRVEIVRILFFFLHFISKNAASPGGVFAFDHKNTTDRNNFAFKTWSENLR